MANSGHVDAINAYADCVDATLNQKPKRRKSAPKVPKAQDLHTMLDTILASHRDLEQTGFIWRLNYNGKIHQDIEFVLFCPFFKVDSDESDKLCGKCTVRTNNVAQLCRCCECPTADTDKPLLRFPHKTAKKVQKLANRGDLDGLKNISQQNIQNSLCEL